MSVVMRALFVSLIACFAGGVLAQKDMLRGINDVYLAIESLDQDATNCNVQQDTIETALRFVLQQSKLKLAAAISNAGYLYARATITSACAIAYSLELKVPVTVSAN